MPFLYIDTLGRASILRDSALNTVVIDLPFSGLSYPKKIFSSAIQNLDDIRPEDYLLDAPVMIYFKEDKPATSDSMNDCNNSKGNVSDSVNHPSHYETGAPFECIDVMLETQGVEDTKGFCVCNAMKYIYRHRRKNGVEDLKKARWYLDKYIELEGGETDD